MTKASGIYQIRNTVNGKRYIGSAKSFHTRWAKHRSTLRQGKHHSRRLQNAYNKHGKKAFVFEILMVCVKEDLLFYEQRALDRLQPKYNMSPTAGNTLGVACGPERRRKIGEVHKGKVLTEEHKKAISEGSKGRRPTPETLEKLKAASQRKAADPEFCRKVSEGKKGKACSEAHKAAISASKKGKPANLSEEGRLRKNAKIAEANRTRTITDQHRENASKAQRDRTTVERFELHGELLTVLEMSERYDVSRHTLRKRINAGWTVERAVETPSRKYKNGEA